MAELQVQLGEFRWQSKEQNQALKNELAGIRELLQGLLTQNQSPSENPNNSTIGASHLHTLTADPPDLSELGHLPTIRRPPNLQRTPLLGKPLDDPLADSVSLKQGNDSVEEYLDKFECALTRNLTPLQSPKLPLLRDSMILPCKSLTPPSYKYPTTPLLPLPDATKQPPNHPLTLPNILANQHFEKPHTKFSYEEMQERRNKGLCMFCDEIYSSGHHVKHKRSQIFVMECDDAENCKNEDFLKPDEVKDESPDLNSIISVKALDGSSTFNCMRIIGQHGKRKLYILIDPCGTHNFIDLKVAKDLGCLLEIVKTVSVTAANGNCMISAYSCSNFTWRMQGYTFSTDIKTLPLYCCDLVLGVQWLTTLGHIWWDFSYLRMEFTIGNQKHILRGFTKASCKIIKGCSLNKLMLQGPHITLLQIQEFSESTTSHIIASSASILSHITEGAAPINQRPYQYTILQKDVIDKLIKDMLTQGIIQYSSSPYASPVDLVKKKDGLINHIFRDIPRKYLLVFFDVILLYSSTCEDHIQHIQMLFSILRLHWLHLQFSKYTFSPTIIEYLDHYISEASVCTDPKKIEAVQQWPIPHNQKQLKSSLGLANYYSVIAQPLTSLLMKEGFILNSDANKALIEFKAALSSAPSIHLPYLPGESLGIIVDRILQKREDITAMLKFHLLQAQNRMKQHADAHRFDREFTIDDYIYLKLQPYRQHFMKIRIPGKLSPRFYEPCLIIDCVGQVAYKLALPPAAAIHHVFHVSQLILCPSPPSFKPAFPKYLLEQGIHKEPELILDKQVDKRGNVAAIMALIKWKRFLKMKAHGSSIKILSIVS